VPTPNVHLDVWDHVESYTIHMILARRLGIISKSHKNPFGATRVKPHSVLMLHSVLEEEQFCGNTIH
jgi:hypothetical protein